MLKVYALLVPHSHQVTNYSVGVPSSLQLFSYCRRYIPSTGHQIVWMAILSALALSYLSQASNIWPKQGWSHRLLMTVTLSLNVTIINNSWITLIPLRLLPSAKVQISSSPHINAFYGHKTVCITIDIGATANLIRHATAEWLGLSTTMHPVCWLGRQSVQTSHLWWVCLPSNIRSSYLRYIPHTIKFHGLVKSLLVFQTNAL